MVYVILVKAVLVTLDGQVVIVLFAQTTVQVMVSVLVMMAFAHPLSEFILKHPTLKTLALSFLLLIGVFLIAAGFGKHIEKGYIYFAICFSVLIEALNFRVRSK